MGAMENTLILFLSDNGASAEMMVRGDGNDPAARAGIRRELSLPRPRLVQHREYALPPPQDLGA